MDDYQFFYDDITPINYTGEQKLISDLEKILKNTANILIDWQIREDSIRKFIISVSGFKIISYEGSM